MQFQRIARRDKKAFFSNQCKEIEENNRMGKARDLFKKIRDTKGTFHAKMGSIKDRNGMDQEILSSFNYFFISPLCLDVFHCFVFQIGVSVLKPFCS